MRMSQTRPRGRTIPFGELRLRKWGILTDCALYSSAAHCGTWHGGCGWHNGDDSGRIWTSNWRASRGVTGTFVQTAGIGTYPRRFGTRRDIEALDGLDTTTGGIRAPCVVHQSVLEHEAPEGQQLLKLGDQEAPPMQRCINDLGIIHWTMRGRVSNL